MTTPSNSAAPLPTPADSRVMMALLGGYRISRALHVVTELGITDLLASGPKSSDALASETKTHAPTLRRVMRFLCGVGVFHESATNQFALTPLGATLRTGVTGSCRGSLLWLLGEREQKSWPNLMHTVKTGQTAFDFTYGMRPFDQLRIDPENSALFNASMTNNSARAVAELIKRYDFASFTVVADIGGNYGRTIGAVLQANPSVRGMLYDLPDVVASAGQVLQELGVQDRCTAIGGSFFEHVPKGADAYILRQILHDWNDADCVKILRHCRVAMGPECRLLVIERELVPDHAAALLVRHTDMEMLVNVGGLERTSAEYSHLFEQAGLKLDRVVSLGDSAGFAVFEGRPV